MTTQGFPAEVVLPTTDQLSASATKKIQQFYPKYRSAINGRVALALQRGGGRPLGESMREARQQLNGLEQLQSFCDALGRGKL